MHAHEISQAIRYNIIIFALFLCTGFYLGVIPFLNFQNLGLTEAIIGQAGAIYANGNGINLVYNMSYPYGAGVSEGFGLLLISHFFLVLGFEDYLSVQLTYFSVYIISFVSLFFFLKKITKNHFPIIIVVIILFYADPFLITQSGIPFMFLGILVIPVIAVAEYYNYIYLKNAFENGLKYFNYKIILLNIAIKLFAVSMGWYTAVICACGFCLFLLLFAVSLILKNIKNKIFVFKIIKTYFVYVLLTWIIAMGIVAAVTPSSVASFKSPLTFYNATSTDIATLFLPKDTQVVSNIIPSIKDVLDDKVLAGDGTMWSNYLGFTMLFILFASVIFKKLRSVEIICLVLTFFVGLVLSFGPGLKFMSTVDSMTYTYPLENTVKLPWSELFTSVFPLTSMRTVYRWIVISKFAIIIIFALMLLKTWNTKKIIAVILSLFAVFEFLPSASLFKMPVQYLNMAEKVQTDVIKEVSLLKNAININDENTAVYPTYDYSNNAFMVSWITNHFGLNSYTGLGDKAVNTGKKYAPSLINAIQTESNPENMAVLISKIKEYGVSDFVVLPYFSLRDQSYYWPPNNDTFNKTKNIAEKTENLLKDAGFNFPVHNLSYLKVFDLRYSDTNHKDFKTDFSPNNPITKNINTSNCDKIYIYGLAQVNNSSKSSSFNIKVTDNSGNIIENFTIPADTEFIKAEKEIYLTDFFENVTVTIKPIGNIEGTIKNLIIKGVNTSNIYTNTQTKQLMQLGMKDVALTSNIQIKDDGIHFANNGYVTLEGKTSKKISNLDISFDIFIKEPKDPNNVNIITKWTHWRKDMSLIIGMKKDKSFIGLTSDGQKENMTWFDNTLLPQNTWHNIKFTFTDGLGVLYIDNNKVLEKNYPFTEIYNTDATPFMIGNGLHGIINNFNCVYR